MRWNRLQYLDLMTFQNFPRPFFAELFGPLVGLDHEWLAQGATPDELNLSAFDFDYVPVHHIAANTGPILTPPVTLLDTPELLVQRDGLGRTLRLVKATATLPLPETFPVQNMDDWLKLKPLFLDRLDRIAENALAQALHAQSQGHLTVVHLPGAFDLPRELMGEEVACLAYYEQPELMTDIIDTLSNTAFAVLDRLSQHLVIDQLSVHEDFAGRSGPLVGPTQITAYFRPYYRRIWHLLQSRGTRIFMLDSDGNINPVIDALLDTGLNAMHPMEPTAGMDIVALRKTYSNRLAMAGGIDKHVLRRSQQDIRRELEYKLQPLMRQTGGIVFGLDHRIPNGTPLANYRFYVALAREILGLPPCSPDRKGWGRMAF